ncbi:ABC transporter permease [Ferrimonas pelagia]|uniref:ABC transporter permease n=1 Tax=Ferrimonas pelagia TaxID=1177826 RepID=A0ABP9FCZ5_9GAMM
MQSIIEISGWQLAAFMTVILIPLAINAHFRLALGRDMLIAVARMTVQLLLVGLYLQFVFERDSALLNTLWLIVMIFVGASSILSSAKIPQRHLYPAVLGGLLIGLLPILALLLLGLLRPVPLYNAQYLIPLAGMLLGNSLSGNIIALQRLFGGLTDRFELYQGALALGATPSYAARPFVQHAMQQAQAPILATMTATGLVTLPGMMTGQILSGSDPMIAVKYQLVIMLAIFAMLSLSVTACLLLTVRMVLAADGRIRLSLSQTP